MTDTTVFVNRAAVTTGGDGTTDNTFGTQVDAGTDDTGTNDEINETGQNFTSTVTVDDIVHNVTKDTYALVVSVASDTRLTLGTMTVDSSDTYTIHNPDFAYQSLNLAEAAEQTTISSGDHLFIKCRGTAADDTFVNISGWTVTGNLTIMANRDVSDGFYNSTLEWSTSHYRISHANGFFGVTVNEDNTTIDGLQLEHFRNGTFVRAISINGDGITIKNNRVRISSSSGTNYCLLYESLNQDNTRVFNNIISGGPSNPNGIHITPNNFNSSTIDIWVYNNLIRGCDIGIHLNEEDNATSVHIRNNLIFDCTDDIFEFGTWANLTIDYNAFEEGFDQDPSQSNEFDMGATDWSSHLDGATDGNPDYNPVASGALDGNGLGSASDSEVPLLDLLGVTRSTTAPTIGPIELVAGGAPIPPQLLKRPRHINTLLRM